MSVEAKARGKQTGTHYKRGGTTSSEAARMCPDSRSIKACLNCKRRRCVFDKPERRQ